LNPEQVTRSRRRDKERRIEIPESFRREACISVVRRVPRYRVNSLMGRAKRNERRDDVDVFISPASGDEWVARQFGRRIEVAQAIEEEAA
jgi:hypothetical protein